MHYIIFVFAVLAHDATFIIHTFVSISYPLMFEGGAGGEAIYKKNHEFHYTLGQAKKNEDAMKEQTHC